MSHTFCGVMGIAICRMPRAGYLVYPFQNQEVNSHAGNLKPPCAGYLEHPFKKEAHGDERSGSLSSQIA